MNSKKESILKDNIYNFTEAVQQLNNGYVFRNELKMNKYIPIVERYATRLYTHYEDWTTSSNDLFYLDKIKKMIFNNLDKESLHENLTTFIKEQSDIDNMMYYTYELLHLAKIL